MSFSADLRDFCKKEAPEKTGKMVRQILLEIHNRIDYRSPVGDVKYWKNPEMAPPGYVGGRFRLNWQYSFGIPETGEIDGADPTGSTVRMNVMSGVMTSPVAGIHYLVNNVPYAERIEMGHSKNQAPFGVVGLTELEFPQIVEMAKR